MSSQNKRERQLQQARAATLERRAYQKDIAWRAGKAERRRIAEASKVAAQFNDRMAKFKLVHVTLEGATVTFLSDMVAVVAPMNRKPYYVNLNDGKTTPVV